MRYVDAVEPDHSSLPSFELSLAEGVHASGGSYRSCIVAPAVPEPET